METLEDEIFELSMSVSVEKRRVVKYWPKIFHLLVDRYVEAEFFVSLDKLYETCLHEDQKEKAVHIIRKMGNMCHKLIKTTIDCNCSGDSSYIEYDPDCICVQCLEEIHETITLDKTTRIGWNEEDQLSLTELAIQLLNTNVLSWLHSKDLLDFDINIHEVRYVSILKWLRSKDLIVPDDDIIPKAIKHGHDRTVLKWWLESGYEGLYNQKKLRDEMERAKKYYKYSNNYETIYNMLKHLL